MCGLVSQAGAGTHSHKCRGRRPQQGLGGQTELHGVAGAAAASQGPGGLEGGRCPCGSALNWRQLPHPPTTTTTSTAPPGLAGLPAGVQSSTCWGPQASSSPSLVPSLPPEGRRRAPRRNPCLLSPQAITGQQEQWDYRKYKHAYLGKR